MFFSCFVHVAGELSTGGVCLSDIRLNEYFHDLYAPSPGPKPSPRLKAWLELLEDAPLLAKLEKRRLEGQPPPAPLADYMLLKIAAACTDPRTRETMQAIFFHLLKDDIDVMIRAYLERNDSDG